MLGLFVYVGGYIFKNISKAMTALCQKWRQRPDLTIAVDWDVKLHFKQTLKEELIYSS